MEAIYQAIMEKKKLHLLDHKGKIVSYACQILKRNGKKINIVTIKQLDTVLSDDNRDYNEKIRLMQRVCNNCLNNI